MDLPGNDLNMTSVPHLGEERCFHLFCVLPALFLFTIVVFGSNSFGQTSSGSPASNF